MKYFNLNIKINDKSIDRLTPAEVWLDKRKAAPIFYGKWSPDELKAGDAPYHKKATNEAVEFIGLNSASGDRRLVTIDSGFVWIYKIVGSLEYGQSFSFKDGEFSKKKELVIPKYYPIKIIKKSKISDVPYILAAMKSSQAFARGTFTEINKNGTKYIGNIAAIRSVLGESEGLSVNPFRCLSSVELETLVAKIFETYEAFVPAHRGAVLKDVDIFADLRSAHSTIRDEFPRVKKLSIQVKISITEASDVRSLVKFLELDTTHVLITAEESPNQELMQYYDQGRYKTSQWLQQHINKLPRVKNWFESSLSWLPKETRELTS